MLLSFKAEEEKNFISNDILDFFVSEVQRHFLNINVKESGYELYLGSID